MPVSGHMEFKPMLFKKQLFNCDCLYMQTKVFFKNKGVGNGPRKTFKIRKTKLVKFADTGNAQ